MMSFPGTGELVTPGTQLSAARKAAGLSVAEVAAQMRISPKQVEALEADRYPELPGTVFVRGFIRNYARVLKLDPVPLLHALEPVLGEEAPLKAQVTAGKMPESTRRNHSKWLLTAFAVLIVLVIAAGALELWSRREQAPADGSASKRETIVLPQKPLESQSAPVPPPATPADGALQSQTPPADVSPPAAVEPAPPSPVPAATRDERMKRIAIQFAQEAWVEVRDRNGQVLITGNQPKSSERQLDGMPPFTVAIGNVGGVRITYNEKPLDLSSYAARNIARFTLE